MIGVEIGLRKCVAVLKIVLANITNGYNIK